MPRVWQWLYDGAQLSDGGKITPVMIRETIQARLDQMRASLREDRYGQTKFPQAAQLFECMMVSPECKEFLTLEAYRYL